MREMVCPGLPAAWLNGWLAAVGATVLDSRVRLHWTTDTGPLAVLSAKQLHPAEILASAWPSREFLESFPISENWRHTGQFRRRIPLETFIDRVRAVRGHPYSWTLSSTLTDLEVDRRGEVEHAPFDPSGPGTTKWLHHRLLRVHSNAASPSADRLSDSLNGLAKRIKDFGLGFDATRLGSLADASSNWVDPVAEVLAFFALKLLPVRGTGIDRRDTNSSSSDCRQRGWQRSGRRRNPARFKWPAWSQPLDSFGIDALLDYWTPDRRNTWSRYGVHAGWQSVGFQSRSLSDPIKAFASEQLHD